MKLEKAMSEFIAAMDNSGGSAGGVLDTYEQEWNDEDKMEKIHAFRLRMINATEFTKENIWACILYKDSVERRAVPVLDAKGIKSILKIDSGCNEDGTLKDFNVDSMCKFALNHGCYGTKMRSIVKGGSERIADIVGQQFELAQQICDHGLVPIVEPEVSIDAEDKTEMEQLLLEQIEMRLQKFQGQCILKLTLPTVPGLYDKLQMHKKVNWVVALSGGYSLDECCEKLAVNSMGASFSRALSEGLKYSMTDNEFDAAINTNIKRIVQATN